MSYIKKGDLVTVISGRDKGKIGKVLSKFPAVDKVIIEGINLVKKHQKKRSQDQPGGIITVEIPIGLSKISLYCSKCKRGVRVRVDNRDDKVKKRICGKCQTAL